MRSSEVTDGQVGRVGQYNLLRKDAYASSILLAHEQDTPDLTVYVEPGSYYINNTRVDFAGGNSPSFTAPATNPRIDLLSINASGTLVRTAGAEAGSPSAPALPFAHFPIAQIYNRVSQTEIFDTDQGGSTGYILKDTRMFESLIDVINEASADGTPANNAGRVTKVEADGKHSRNFIHQNQKTALLAGENITGATTPQACFILSEQRANRNAVVSNVESSVENQFEVYDNVTNDNRIGHRFSTGSFDRITGFAFTGEAQGNIDSDSYVCELFAVDGSGNPTGAALGSKAFTKATANKSNSQATQAHWYIQFDSPISVSQSTIYIIVIAETTQGGDTTNNIQVNVNSGPASNNISRYSTNGGASWSPGYPGQSGGGFARTFVYGYLSTTINGGTVGRVYLSDGNDPDRNYFDGFVNETDTAGNSVDLLFGTDIPGFTGLLPGTDYFLDTTPGAITATKAKGKKVGTARSTTSMGANHRAERSDQYNTDVGNEYDFSYASSAGAFNANGFVYASSTTVNQVFVYIAKLYHQAKWGLFTKRVRSSQEITNEKKDIAFMVNQGEYARNASGAVTFSHYSIWYDL